MILLLFSKFQPDTGKCAWKDGKCQTDDSGDDSGDDSDSGDGNERKSCDERTTKTWCTNKWQPPTGPCKWLNKKGKCKPKNPVVTTTSATTTR